MEGEPAQGRAYRIENHLSVRAQAQGEFAMRIKFSPQPSKIQKKFNKNPKGSSFDQKRFEFKIILFEFFDAQLNRKVKEY